MKHIARKLIFGVLYLLIAAWFAFDAPAAFSEIGLRLFVLCTLTLGILRISASLKRTTRVEVS